MPTNPSTVTLARLNRTRAAIDAAETVSDLKLLRDQAVLAVGYLKQQRHSLAVQNQAAEVKLRAERKLGLLLAGTIRAGNPKLCQDATIRKLPSGITRSQSSRWQRIADLPNSDFEGHIAEVVNKGKELTTAGLLRLAKNYRHQVKRTEHHQRLKSSVRAMTSAAKRSLDRVCLVRSCDFRDLLADLPRHSLDSIVTDPPFLQNDVRSGLFQDLARLAKRALKDDGRLAVLVGQTYLPIILAAIDYYIPYRWTMCFATPGIGTKVWGKKVVRSTWKPVLVFGGGRNWLPRDVVMTQERSPKKNFHPWEQSETAWMDLVSIISRPGDIICDPFIGSGVCGISCLKLGRRFIGCDIDPEVATLARARCAAMFVGRD